MTSVPPPFVHSNLNQLLKKGKRVRRMAKQIDAKKLSATKQDFKALLKKACSPKAKSSPKQSKT